MLTAAPNAVQTFVCKKSDREGREGEARTVGTERDCSSFA